MANKIQKAADTLLEIGSVNLVRMTNDSHFMFMKTSLEHFEANTALQGNEPCQAAIKALVAAIEEEDNCLLLSRRSELTESITEGDKLRDSYFYGYRTGVKSHLRHPDAQKVAAAKTLWLHLKEYGGIPTMQLDKATSRFINFIQDLEGKYADLVSLLALDSYVRSIKTTNAHVERQLAQRVREQSETPIGALVNARTDSDTAYARVIKVINAMAILTDPEAVRPIINFQNSLIKRYKEQVIPSSKKGSSDLPQIA